MSAGAWALGPDSYEAPRVKGGDLAAWRTRQCGIEDTAAPSPSWRGWSSPEAACGAPKAQGLRNVANSVIIKSESSAFSGCRSPLYLARKRCGDPET
jgi:hypothetical protein